MIASSYQNNDRITFYRIFFTARKQSKIHVIEAAGFKMYLNMNVINRYSTNSSRI